MHLHEIGLYKKSRLAGTGAAHNQHVFIPGMGRVLRPALQHQPFGLRQDDVALRLRRHKGGNI
jgi:hypothetical protein